MEDGMAHWLPVIIGIAVAIVLAFAVAFGAFSKKPNAKGPKGEKHPADAAKFKMRRHPININRII
jgi:hypothetical protein